MKNTKHLLILFLCVQIFAAPIVKSCIGMASLTENNCCPPDNCACDVNDVEINLDVDATVLDAKFKVFSAYHHVFFKEEILALTAVSLDLTNFDLPPPLRKTDDPFSFFQVYII